MLRLLRQSKGRIEPVRKTAIMHWLRYIPLIFNIIDSIVSLLLALIVFVIVLALVFLVWWALIKAFLI
jgi:hypothetical protein